jgi:hypothetical protein
MKVWVYIHGEDGAVRKVSWYMGTSDILIEKAVRMIMNLDMSIPFLFRDSDGDLVPVSSTLPHDQHYTLVTSNLLQENNTTQVLTNIEVEEAHGRKRRKIRSISRPISTTKTPSIGLVITQFLEVFTRPIDNDDNINFIPNIGRYALYELFKEIIADESLHPKSSDSFYKMVSMQGKVDRQRVIRYHQAQNSSFPDRTEYIQLKPQGKGPFLRRYLSVESGKSIMELVRAASFLSPLGISPEQGVSKYVQFIKGFVPISKALYQAHDDHESLLQ